MSIHDSHPLGEVPGERTFLEGLAARLGISQPLAEQVAGGVLGPLELFLQPLEAEALEAELPISVRRAIHRVEHGPADTREDVPYHEPKEEDFIRRVSGRLHITPGNVAPLAAAVFDAVRPLLSERVRTQVANRLPAELKARWLGPM